MMTNNKKDYELKIAITENGSRLQTINTKDNLSLELFTNKGYLQITFTKWDEDGKGGSDDR